MPVKLNIHKLIRDKQFRDGRDISISEVAKEIDVSRNGLYHYINGNSKAFELLDTLCNYFDCEPGDLLIRTTEKDTTDV